MLKRFKNTTVILLIITIITSFSGIVLAQQNKQKGPPPIPTARQIEKMVNELASELELNKEQKQEISDLYFTHFEGTKKKMEQERSNRDSHREKMDKLRAGFEKEVKAVLTQKQQELFDEFNQKKGPKIGRQQPPKH